MSEVKIRSLKDSDMEKLRPMILRLHAMHYEKRPDIYKEVISTEHFFDDSNAHGFALVAECEDEPVGFCCVNYLERTNPLLVPARIAYIDDIFVDESHRRQGIGKFFFECVCTEAKRIGANKVELNVYSFNTNAIKFYESLGMTAENIRMEKPI